MRRGKIVEQTDFMPWFNVRTVRSLSTRKAKAIDLERHLWVWPLSCGTKVLVAFELCALSV
jgi:hypothetical protein